jgi:hypothetical protein
MGLRLSRRRQPPTALVGGGSSASPPFENYGRIRFVSDTEEKILPPVGADNSVATSANHSPPVRNGSVDNRDGTATETLSASSRSSDQADVHTFVHPVRESRSSAKKGRTAAVTFAEPLGSGEEAGGKVGIAAEWGRLGKVGGAAV